MKVSNSKIRYIAALLTEDPNLINDVGSELEVGSIKRRNVPLLDTLGPRDPRQIFGDVQFDFDYMIGSRGSRQSFDSPGESPEIEIIDVEPIILSARTPDGRQINPRTDGDKYTPAAKSYFMNHLIELATQSVTDKMNDRSF